MSIRPAAGWPCPELLLAATDRLPPARREEFLRFIELTPRWKDLDAFGHINNAEFYSFFDTAIVQFLMSIGAFAVRDSQYIAMVAESGARFHREVHFDDRLTVGLAVKTIGRSSWRYQIGVFCNEDENAAVDGFFVHVLVDRQTRRPSPIQPDLRHGLESLLSTQI